MNRSETSRGKKWRSGSSGEPPLSTRTFQTSKPFSKNTKIRIFKINFIVSLLRLITFLKGKGSGFSKTNLNLKKKKKRKLFKRNGKIQTEVRALWFLLIFFFLLAQTQLLSDAITKNLYNFTDLSNFWKSFPPYFFFYVF